MSKQSIVKGFAVLSIAGIIVKLISLLYVPFLIRIITREGYGIYGITYQIFVFVYVITNSGVPVAISKLISELTALKNYKDAAKAFRLARFMLLVLGVVMSLIMLLLAKPIANFVNERVYLALLALTPTILITSVLSAYRGYFQGRGDMTPTAVSQIAEQVINTVFSLVFAAVFIKISMEAGVAGATIGTTLGALVACVYLMIHYKKHRKFRVQKGSITEEPVRLPNKILIHKLISYGVPITICIGLQNAGNLVDMFNVNKQLLVAGFDKSSASIMYGSLILFTTLINVPISLISALSAAVLPAISGAAAVNDKKKVGLQIGYSIKLCFIVALPSAAGLMVLSAPMYMLFSGYYEGSQLLKYGGVVIVLMAVVQIQTTIMQSIGKLYTATVAMLIGITVKIIGNYILVAMPSINILGAIAGNIACFSIPILINSYQINKALKIKVGILRKAVIPAFSSLIMAIAVHFCYKGLYGFILQNNPNKFVISICVVIAVGVGIVIYAGAMIMLGGIKEKDINTISPKLNRFIPTFVKERMK